LTASFRLGTYLTSRLAAELTGWEHDHAKFEAPFERVVTDCRWTKPRNFGMHSDRMLRFIQRGPWVVVGVAALLISGELSTRAAVDNVVAAAGGVSLAGNVCLSFTVGEAAVEGGASGQAILTAGFQQPSSYDYWSTAQGLASGPLGDADADGLWNLLEYAYGTNPLNAASTAKPQGSIGPGGKFYITMAKGTAAGDLLWSAEVSTDLVHWSTQGVNVALNDATTFSALYTGNAPAAFMRLRLDLIDSK